MPDFNLFDFNYQISDPAWKIRLEELIKNYFFFYEIGSETPDRFKHNFKNRMQLIMPRYDKLYTAILLNNKPLTNTYLSETITQTAGTATTAASTDYPQHDDPLSDIPTTKSAGTSDSNSTYSRTLEGATGKSYSALLIEYQQALYDLELMIIKDLKNQFILVH